MTSTCPPEAQNAVGLFEVERHSPSAKAAEGRPKAAKYSSHEASILLVEDDETLRRVTSSLLTEAGYRVCECSTATKAREKFYSGIHVDLLVTDLRMPGPSGITLAKELSLLQMRLPVMIVSGDSPDQAAWCDWMTRGWRFLNKPYAESAFLTAIDELLDVHSEVAAAPMHVITNAEPLGNIEDRFENSLTAAHAEQKTATSAKGLPERKVRLLSIGDDAHLLASRALVFESAGYDTCSLNSSMTLELCPFSGFDCAFICHSVERDKAVVLANLIRVQEPRMHIVRLSKFKFNEPNAFTSICDTTYDPQLFLADVREIVYPIRSSAQAS